MNKLPASTGWTWLKNGALLFRQQPAALTTLLFANILVSILISAVPVLGAMVAVVLIPSFSMAFMMACSMIENGQRVTPAVALTGFRKPVLRELCKVGIVYLGVSLILTLITRFAVQPDFWEQVQAQSTSGTPAVLAGQDVLAMFLIFALDAVALISLCFAAPLTYWQKMPPFKAVFYSFFAVKRSAGFFTVCMVIAVILGGSSIARVVIMWVIFLFILLLQCALYVGYREIFGKPPAEPGSKVNLDKQR
jgi:hypothetical protein